MISIYCISVSPQVLWIGTATLNMFLLILEKGRGRETHHCERNIDWLPPVHTPTGLETWACTLTWNRTDDLLVHRTKLNQVLASAGSSTLKETSYNQSYHRLTDINKS